MIYICNFQRHIYLIIGIDNTENIKNYPHTQATLYSASLLKKQDKSQLITTDYFLVMQRIFMRFTHQYILDDTCCSISQQLTWYYRLSKISLEIL